MLTVDKKIGVVFNGEIYGYKKIKEDLKDYPFRTTSDTELLLALYKKHGSKNMLDKLPGMFAFAIWDNEAQELFAARDRFGEKPFFYAEGKNGEFVFASEIKAILASGLVDPILDTGSVAHYLKHLYVNPYKTIYSNIHTLPPAHALTVKHGNISIWRYWQMPETNEKITLEEATEKFGKLFKNAVESQLVADVPVGAFLSGGLDSSTVVAIASDYQQKLKTFSFRFREGNDELPYAREIAERYKTDHTELFDDENDIGELLLKMDDVYDEPFADSSNIATYIISRLARKHVTVVLTGDGGDELMGGYGSWYKPFVYAAGGKMSLSSKTEAMIPHLMKALHKAHVPYRNQLGDVFAGAKLRKNFPDVFSAHEAQNTYFSDEELMKLFVKKDKGTSTDTSSCTSNTPDASSRNETYKPHWNSKNTLDDVMRMDIDNYMPGDILVKIDRAAMANSLELRAPFLDVDFASFCISLPFRLKIDKKKDKIILRKAFSSHLTHSILNRHKQGFGAPVTKWLKLPSVKKIKEEYLADRSKKIFSLLSYDAVHEKINDDTYQTWVLLVLAIWMEKRDVRL